MNCFHFWFQFQLAPLQRGPAVTIPRVAGALPPHRTALRAHVCSTRIYYGLGRAVQVDPIKPTLKPTGIQRLKLMCATLLPTLAFGFNLRLYSSERKVIHRRNKEILDKVPIFGNLPEEARNKLAHGAGAYTR
jgi:hypothetical protein